MSHTQEFKHMTVHVIDIDTQRVVWYDEFRDEAYWRPGQIITRGGMSYQVKRQQTGVDHIYAWVESKENY